MEPLYRGHIGTLNCPLYRGYPEFRGNTVEPLYKGHIGTLEQVLYIEVVLNSEVICSGTSL